MNSLMLLQKEFPPDIRIEKEAGSLHKGGHSIILLCKGSGVRPREETVDGIHVCRIQPDLPLLRKLAGVPIFPNPFWLWYIWRLIRRFQIDVIHAHDLPMIPFALPFKKWCNVVFDMHEHYPASIRVWYQNHPNLLKRWLGKLRFADALERFSCRRSDFILVVTEEQKERLVRLGIPSGKIAIVSNREKLDLVRSVPADVELERTYGSKRVILFAGNFAGGRGLDIPIRALKKIRARYPDVLLLMIGEGREEAALRRLAEELGVLESVEFVPWQPFEKVPAYIRIASICINPQPASECIDHTLSHKVFQYMALRKPVVVSDSRPIKRIVERYHAGEIYRSGDPEDFARACLQIFQNPDGYYDRNGEQMDREISWERDEEALLRVYQRMGS